MKLKFYRDELRAVQLRFIPYLVQICNLDKNQAPGSQILFNAIMIRDIFFQVKKTIDRKLLTAPNRLTVSLTDSQAIVFYQLLMRIPLDPGDVWICALRQRVCDELYQQIIKGPA